MKEQTIIEMKNKIETLGMINQRLIKEMDQLATLAMGTLETLKHMQGYEQAIEKVKEQMVAESGKAKEADTSRKTLE
jgi:hypothetical protein|tara:strand:+ start:98 stop:328 length:231 start_codon:yes stop_codon:yes gene_type:complete